MQDSYIISKATIEKVLQALGNNWFRLGADEEEYNNDDIIEAEELLRKEIDGQ